MNIEEILNEYENSYSSIVLADLIDTTQSYIDVLPANGILYTYQYYDDIGVSYNFSKTSAFKGIFEFYVKFKVGEIC